MAVMTSQHLEGVAIEHKIEPVPSDKMALDLDINGTSNRDETNHDALSEIAVNKIAPSSIDQVVLDEVVVNGDANAEAFSSNQSTEPTPVNFASDSQPPAPSPPSVPTYSEVNDSNTSSTEPQSSLHLEAQQIESSTGLTIADSAIEAAVDDIGAPSSVLPVVEAPQSDLRSTSVPPSSAEPLADREPEPALGTSSPMDDSQLNTLSQVNTHQIENDVAQIEINATEKESQDAQPESLLADIEDDTAPSTAGSNRADPLSMSLPEASELKPPPQADHTTSDQSAHSTTPSQVAAEQADTEMADVSEHSTKVAREREDDDELAPSAKRAKTDEDEPMADASTQSAEASNATRSISPYQVKEIVKNLKNLARTKDGKNFREPVTKLWPTFAAPYAEKISHPTDLHTMEIRLKDSTYTSMEEFQTDVKRLYDNAFTFNGPDHEVTKSAMRIRDSILNSIATIPAQPVAPPKKEKKPRLSTPTEGSAPRTSAPRRMSRGAPTAATTPAAPTFALDPVTSTPLIRRDSTKGDGGRPKREIHPPKNKDLPYTVRPKSKKNTTELKFCDDVVNELQKVKYASINSPFLEPVDPVALNIPNYFTVIKKPMDLQTVSRKLKEGIYSSATEFEKDVRQIFVNCYKYNPAGNVVNGMGKEMEALFNREWAKKDQYIADHTPSAASPESDEESEEEEEEEEEEVTAQQSSNALSALKERLLAEQQKLIEVMSDKSADPAILSMQQDMVQMIQSRIDAAAKQAQAKPPTKKRKLSKVTKKSAPSKKPGPSKKGAGARAQRYLGTLEKETISNGLGALPENIMENVVNMIKREKPDLENESDGTMELDIDAISVPTLWKIHALIMEYNPEVEAQLKEQMQDQTDNARSAAKPATKKKNKPMSKQEQERKIQSLTKKVEQFERHGSNSQEPVIPTVETQEDSSSDESASEEE